jgi:hypothetical protein
MWWWTVTPPHSHRNGRPPSAAGSHRLASSRAEPIPRTHPYGHSATSSAGSVASRPATPSRALIGVWNAARSIASTTDQMTRASWPAGIRSSSHPNRMVTWARSGCRSRTSPTGMVVAASEVGVTITAL